jgi:probable F420-dependent oxidoreductase
LAVAGEERGFDSIWIPEHSHIPVSRMTPFPGGGDLPKQYYDCMDPFVALAAAAAVTKTIMLGFGICLVIQRDPIQMAKEVATLDQISGGRVLFGVGGGWNADEIANHGTEFKTRFKVMRERIEAMKVIWTEEEAEYHGEYVDFNRIIARPKPVQKPYPPIIVGGGFPHSARRVIEYGDGWIPIGGRDLDIVGLLAEFRKMASDAGRDPEALGVSVFGLNTANISEDEIARYRDADVERIVFMLPSQDRNAVMPMLDQAAALMSVARS